MFTKLAKLIAASTRRVEILVPCTSDFYSQESFTTTTIDVIEPYTLIALLEEAAQEEAREEALLKG